MIIPNALLYWAIALKYSPWLRKLFPTALTSCIAVVWVGMPGILWGPTIDIPLMRGSQALKKTSAGAEEAATAGFTRRVG
jgi:hypothetical protein